MTLGFAQLAATPVPPLAEAFARINAWLLGWIIGVVGTVARLPGAHIDVTPPAMWQIVAYDVLITIAAWAIHVRRYRSTMTLAVAARSICAVGRSPHHGDVTITAN